MKLAVCIPRVSLYECGPWAHHINNVVRYPQGTIFIKSYSFPIATARNSLIDEAIRQKCTHVLFIDDDIWPPADGVEKLIQAKQSIVAGLCKYKTHVDKWVIFPPTLQYGSGVTEVREVGAGFILIDVDVFQTIAGGDEEYDYFRWAGKTRKPNGEDISFCRLAQAHGFKIFVDRDVKCGHHDLVVFNDSVYGYQRVHNYKRGINPAGTIEIYNKQ